MPGYTINPYLPIRSREALSPWVREALTQRLSTPTTSQDDSPLSADERRVFGRAQQRSRHPEVFDVYASHPGHLRDYLADATTVYAGSGSPSQATGDPLDRIATALVQLTDCVCTLAREASPEGHEDDGGFRDVVLVTRDDTEQQDAAEQDAAEEQAADEQPDRADTPKQRAAGTPPAARRRRGSDRRTSATATDAEAGR